MHICVVTPGYPYKDFSAYPFVKQLCVALTDNGVKVTVITSCSLTNSVVRHTPVPPKYRQEKTAKGNIVEIYTQRIITFGALESVPIAYRLCMKYKQWVIGKTIKQLEQKPDVVYGHFWYSGYMAFPYAKRHGIPLFVATGESVIELHKFYSSHKLKSFTEYVSGVVCVSTKNKNESITAHLTAAEKCEVIPNAVDSTLFRKKDKSALRAQYGFGQDDFIVAFVGGFIERKGPKRVAKAIDLIGDPHIKSIFMGSSPVNREEDAPSCAGILFRNRVKHDLIPDYLNCADVFVLPTLHEGCCNANIEALACGLPVISSDRDFNYDILNSECSILVDPMNIEQIADAISTLKNDVALREKMSKSALAKAGNLEINSRAQKILKFIHNNISK